MSAEWPWSALNLDGPTDEKSVKRAYATKLKQIDRSDVDAMQQLRAAVDHARKLAVAASGKEQRSRPKMAEITRQARPAPSTPKPPPVQHAPPSLTPITEETDAQEPTPHPSFQLETEYPKQDPAPPKSVALSTPPPSTKQTAQKTKIAPPKLPEWSEQDTLHSALAELEKILKTKPKFRKTELDALGSIFERVALLDRDYLQAFEEGLARKIISHDVIPTQGLATLIDESFKWVSDLAWARNRLINVAGHELLIGRLAQTFQPKRSWLPFRVSLKRASGATPEALNTIEDNASLAAVLLSLLNAIWQTFFAATAFVADASAVATFFIALLASFFFIIVLAVILEFIWIPLKAIGVGWMARKVYDAIVSEKARRRIALRKPNKRGISLSIGIVIFIYSLFFN